MRVLSRVRSSLVLTALLAAVMVGCGASVEDNQAATVQGSLQEDSSEPSGTSFGGSGTLSATKVIRASAVGPNGKLELVSETTLSADGRYELTVPADAGRMLVQAIDAQGKVLASTVVDVAQQFEGKVTSAPITTQTSVMASVFVEMSAQGMSSAKADLVALRERISERVASEIQEKAAAGRETSAEVKALAQAEIAAQHAELKTYAQASVQITAEALAEVKTEALARYENALAAGADAKSEAREQLDASVDAALKAKAQIDEELRARAEQAASASFRAVLQAKLNASGDAELIDAAIQAEAEIEARATALAVNALLKSASAGQATIESALSAGTTLRANVAAAANAQVVAQAFASFQAAITGNAQAVATTSILGQMIAGDASASAQVEAAIQETLDASAEAGATLESAIDAAVQVGALINLEAAASAVVNAYGAYNAAVKSAAMAHLGGLTPKASASAELLVIAQGGFRQ